MAHAAAAAAARAPSREELHRELMQLRVRIGGMHDRLVRIETMVRTVIRAQGIAEGDLDVAPAVADEPQAKRRKPDRCERH